MRTTIASLLALAAFALGCSTFDCGSKNHLAWDFDSSPLGALPDQWSQNKTGPGRADWRVQETESGKVLAQLKLDQSNLTLKYCPVR